jgi:PilZ domain-containing protein
MGAAPERFGQQGAVSPLREVEYRKESIARFTVTSRARQFVLVPTHAVGVAHERRRYPRAKLALPLRLTRIGAAVEPIPVTLVTHNISSSGVFFLAPRRIELGTSIELEVALIERPLGFGSVQMCTAAHIVRSEDSEMPGWWGYAASFDDFALKRDDLIPLRFHSR